MKKIKLFVRNYKTKAGVEFSKISILGKYLPLVDAKEDVYYNVEFVGDVKKPARAGKYIVGYETSNDMWIDKRLNYVNKPTVRIRVKKVVFDEELTEKLNENESK